MAPKERSLYEHVQEGSFRVSRHRDLLLTDDLPEGWDVLKALQEEYREAETDWARTGIASRFRKVIEHARAETKAGLAGGGPAIVVPGPEELRALLDECGPPGSAERIINFFPRCLRHEVGPLEGQPFHLEDWQQDWLREFHRQRDDGRRVYKSGLWGLPRGCGKTPFASGQAALTTVDTPGSPRVFLGAGSKDQARIGLDFLTHQTTVDDEGVPFPLAPFLRVRTNQLTCRATRGRATILSSEGKLAHGRIPAGGIVDELWSFTTPAQVQLYVALRTALFKRPDSWLMAISTAGHDLNSLLGDMFTRALEHWSVKTSRDGCLTIVRDEESGFLMHWYGVPADVDVDLDDERQLRDLLEAVTPASWVDIDEILRELHAPDTDPLEWLRLHLNYWTHAKGAWRPAQLWTGLETDEKIPKGATIVVAVDAALTYDTTAVGWAWRNPETGRVIHRSHVWSVRDDVQCHDQVPGVAELDNEELVEPFIDRLRNRFRVECVVYDPRFFAVEAKHLDKKGLTVVPMYPQSEAFNDAVSLFYRDCANGKVGHNGDQVLAAHVKATAAKKTERGWRVYKLKSSRPIDAASAAIMAHSQAADADDRVSVYETRGLATVGEDDHDAPDDAED